MKTVKHCCPGCKAIYAISADPDRQPLTCSFCNYPIRMVRDFISNIFALNYAEREVC